MRHINKVSVHCVAVSALLSFLVSFLLFFFFFLNNFQCREVLPSVVGGCIMAQTQQISEIMPSNGMCRHFLPHAHLYGRDLQS